jgi:KaiC/GvpD/RAD55 family RecA-like ATPase
VVDLALVKVGERFERRLFVRKMRGTPTDLGERRFEIVAERGLVLHGQP